MMEGICVKNDVSSFPPVSLNQYGVLLFSMSVNALVMFGKFKGNLSVQKTIILQSTSITVICILDW